MIGAGLVAKKAVERGLKKPAYVKSSLTPGSLVVTEYLIKAGLLESLESSWLPRCRLWLCDLYR